MSAVTIPRGTEKKCRRLTRLSEMDSAIGWERAAIVASMQKDDSITGLAARGIHGLRSRNAVRIYLATWERTSREAPRDGERVELPDTPFPEWADLKPAKETKRTIPLPGTIEKMREFATASGRTLIVTFPVPAQVRPDAASALACLAAALSSRCLMILSCISWSQFQAESGTRRAR